MKKLVVNYLTLTEMIVVAGVIAILAGLILPTIYSSLKTGYRTNCMSNLKQIGLAIQTYKNDYRDRMPPWISTLYSNSSNSGNYAKSVEIFHCEEDGNADGTAAGAWKCLRDGNYSANYDRPNTTAINQNPAPNQELFDDLKKKMNVNGMSYFYEFNASDCPWNSGKTWNETKMTTIKNDSNPNTGVRYKSQLNLFPTVRCSWHWIEAQDAPYLNLAFSGNVFMSKAKWEDGVWTP